MARADAAMRKVERKVERLSTRRKPVMKCSSSKPKAGEEDDGTAGVNKLSAAAAALEHKSVLEELRRKCDENNVDVKLCWSAMNQLCIDNETFRRELEQHRNWLQKLASCAGSKNIPMDEAPDESSKSACSGRWSSSAILR